MCIADLSLKSAVRCVLSYASLHESTFLTCLSLFRANIKRQIYREVYTGKFRTCRRCLSDSKESIEAPRIYAAFAIVLTKASRLRIICEADKSL